MATATLKLAHDQHRFTSVEQRKKKRAQETSPIQQSGSQMSFFRWSIVFSKFDEHNCKIQPLQAGP
jgi:hypothetical protein